LHYVCLVVKQATTYNQHRNTVTTRKLFYHGSFPVSYPQGSDTPNNRWHNASVRFETHMQFCWIAFGSSSPRLGGSSPFHFIAWELSLLLHSMGVPHSTSCY
jgi:hypothetical protein